MLECCAAVDPSLSTFATAFSQFKKGASAAEVYKLFAKVAKYKTALEVSGYQKPRADAFEFKVPAPVLGKRDAVSTKPLHPFFPQPKKPKLEEEEKKKSKEMVCLRHHSLDKREGDDDTTCDVCSSEDCVTGYHHCDICELHFCLGCYRKVIVE